MARQLRIQYPGAFYHVTCRGNERQDIYRDKTDYETFLETLADSLAVHNVSLLAFVCMTNHFHLLLTTPEGNLSEFMRCFNISYTSAFNRRHNRSGHLYQGRYKSFLVDADNYLKKVSRYIHLNPVRIKRHAGKPVKDQIKILSEFKYSSFSGYVNMKNRVDFISYKKVLDGFSGDTTEGRRIYRQFVYKGLKEDPKSPLEAGKGHGIVGSSGFTEYIRNKYLEKIPLKSQREQPHLKAVSVKYAPEKLIAWFCETIKEDQSQICRRGRNSTDRAILMELLYRYCHIKQPEIGLLVGGIDYSAVSVARKRLRLKMEKDASLKRKFAGIVDELSRLKI